MEKHFQIIENQVVYDFDKTMSYLNRYGKSKFGDKFQLRRSDTEILEKLMAYAIRDRKTCESHNIDLEKGILLIGKIGCGKTSLMDIFQNFALRTISLPIAFHTRYCKRICIKWLYCVKQIW
jgi:predicted ATPase